MGRWCHPAEHGGSCWRPGPKSGAALWVCCCLWLATMCALASAHACTKLHPSLTPPSLPLGQSVSRGGAAQQQQQQLLSDARLPKLLGPRTLFQALGLARSFKVRLQPASILWEERGVCVGG